jgi:tRNA pseudouridine55 synthase
VARPAVVVTVHAIDILDFEADRLELLVRCSPGTYVRALARDLGERLGVGGHLAALRRTRSGSFVLVGAVPADELEGGRGSLVPMSDLLPEIPAVSVPGAARRLLRNGRDLGPETLKSEFPPETVARVRLVDEAGELLALAVRRGFEGGGGLSGAPLLHPDVVLLDESR